MAIVSFSSERSHMPYPYSCFHPRWATCCPASECWALPPKQALPPKLPALVALQHPCLHRVGHESPGPRFSMPPSISLQGPASLIPHDERSVAAGVHASGPDSTIKNQKHRHLPPAAPLTLQNAVQKPNAPPPAPSSTLATAICRESRNPTAPPPAPSSTPAIAKCSQKTKTHRHMLLVAPLPLQFAVSHENKTHCHELLAVPYYCKMW